ncbi:hypothetical protein BXZ70DRAFT_906240 [Cristinia sonorae]|uniref:Uncharacterized protein n=1 Tax=Cristinia sonorae TaxID=1940300 RepID=A0A8K0XR80_9AGAR|nr:hypothetical protein BXZ70DRAFT_906240 [Cristinia sonorae]
MAGNETNALHDSTTLKTTVMANNEHLRQLLDSYPAAVTDSYGSGTVDTLHIHQTGPVWPVAPPNTQKFIHAAWSPRRRRSGLRLKCIAAFLDSFEVEVQLTAFDPLAYASAGEAELSCNFVVVISVNPHTLAYQDAVATAPSIIDILENAGFSDARVAFVEAVYRRRQAKFMGFNPNDELESTAAIHSFSQSLHRSLRIRGHRWYLRPSHEALGRIPAPTDDEPSDKTERRRELIDLIAMTKKKITAANELHTSATKSYTFPDSHILGFVYHYGYLYGWAVIQLNVGAGLEAGNLLGNKLYVDWKDYMFPQVHDCSGFNVPQLLLLQLKDYILEDEFRNPQNHDINDVKMLLAVKNGRCLWMRQRHGVTHPPIPRPRPQGRRVRDHRAWIRYQDGQKLSILRPGIEHLIGPITGGGNPMDATDKTYITPYYKLKLQIESVFEKIHLLPVDFNFLFV